MEWGLNMWIQDNHCCFIFSLRTEFQFTLMDCLFVAFIRGDKSLYCANIKQLHKFRGPSASPPKITAKKPLLPADDQKIKRCYLELLVLFPQPLNFTLQPLTFFHHLLNFSVIQRRTQSFRHCWCFCLWCSCGYNFIYFYIMLFRNKWKPKCHQLCNNGLFNAK